MGKGNKNTANGKGNQQKRNTYKAAEESKYTKEKKAVAIKIVCRYCEEKIKNLAEQPKHLAVCTKPGKQQVVGKGKQGKGMQLAKQVMGDKGKQGKGNQGQGGKGGKGNQGQGGKGKKGKAQKK